MAIESTHLSNPYITQTLFMMTAAVGRPPGIPLGSSVPPMTAHAVSVSLPTWADNVGYEEGEKRVVEKMETGYPRFFVHRTIQKVS
jgi:cystathionine gamma-synthase